MATLYPYGIRPHPYGEEEKPVALADLGGTGGQAGGYDLLTVLHDVLTTPPSDDDRVEFPARPSDGEEDTRTRVFSIDPDDVELDASERLIWGTGRFIRESEAEEKRRRGSNRVEKFHEGDEGIRPLFFLVSAPKAARDALVILEGARPYMMAGIWQSEIVKAIKAQLPMDVWNPKGIKRPKSVTLKWGGYELLKPEEFWTKYADGTLLGGSATSVDGKNPDGSPRRITVVSEAVQQVDKKRFGRLIKKNDRVEAAKVIVGAGFVQQLGQLEEVSADVLFNGRQKKLVFGRNTVSQPGQPVPPTTPRVSPRSYFTADGLKEVARDLAETVGHDAPWV